MAKTMLFVFYIL